MRLSTFLAERDPIKAGLRCKFLSLRFLLAFTLFLTSSPVATTTLLRAQSSRHVDPLVFGQVYGSTVFVTEDSSKATVDAADIVLVFETDGYRSLVLVQKSGDFIALLEPGQYCLSAYTRKGNPVALDSRQMKCVKVTGGTDSRLDVLLKSK